MIRNKVGNASMNASRSKLKGGLNSSQQSKSYVTETKTGLAKVST